MDDLGKSALKREARRLLNQKRRKILFVIDDPKLDYVRTTDFGKTPSEKIMREDLDVYLERNKIDQLISFLLVASDGNGRPA